MSSDGFKIEKLNGRNYQSWKYNMKLVLMEKGLWGIADGSEVKVEVAADADAKTKTASEKDWKLRSDKAYSLIALNVEPDIQIHITGTSNAKEAWNLLQKHFEVVSVSHIVRLSRRFYAAVMQEEDDLLDFITKMTSVAQELRELKEDISEKKFATTILGALPESYESFLSGFNTVSADDITWDSVKSLLTEEYFKRKEKLTKLSSETRHLQTDDALFTQQVERGRSMHRGGARRGGNRGPVNNLVEDEAMFTRSSSRGRSAPPRGRGGSGNRTHHLRSHPQNNSQSLDRGMPRFHGKCYNCREFGHQSRMCPHPQRNSDEGYFVADNSSRGNEDYHLSSSYLFQDDLALTTVCSEDIDTDNHHVNDQWYIDSAATRHMTFNKDALLDFRYFSPEEQSDVYLGDDSAVSAVGEGKIRLPVNGPNGKHIALENVAYVPGLAKNLLSVSTITRKNNAEVRFDKYKCVVVKDNHQHVIGHCVNGRLYQVGVPDTDDAAYFTTSGMRASAVAKQTWHFRLGHLNIQNVDKLMNKNMVSGMKMITNKNVTSLDNPCEGCLFGKMSKLPFPKRSNHHAKDLLEIVHTDLCGPMEIPSHGGSRYVLMFTDDCSRYTTVYFLKRKSETLGKFQSYVSLMENICSKKVQKLNIKTLRSDNGGEYKSNEFQNYCAKVGIRREFSTPHCPEQNGVAERFNRTIIESARSMLYHARLPLNFWAEAVNTAVFIRNRCPTVALSNDKTPYECWFNRKPDISHLRIFGSVCYVHIPDSQRTKLDAKSYKAIFVGYAPESKGYKVYNLSSGRFAQSRNVIFNENVFHSFSDKPCSDKVTQAFIPFDDELTVNTLVPTAERQERGVHLIDDESESSSDQVTESEIPVVINPTNIKAVVGPTYEETFLREVAKVSNSHEKRQRNPPKRLIEEDQCNFTESLLADIAEPRSFKEACSNSNSHSTHWKESMDSEFASLMKNDTWELVPRPAGTNIVGCKWIYKVKRGASGEIERFKSRLVAQGFSQTEGVDFTEVYAPVARFPTIRTLLAFANAHDLEVHHMDVTTAFLNGELDCCVYMEQPEGYVDAKHPDFVCKLKRPLYGLKQSGRCWNATLDKFMKSRDFKQSSADECVYIKTVRKDDNHISFVIMGVYVDDIIPVSNDTHLMLKEKKAICERFDMTDNGEISYCLGLSIIRDRANKIITISQGNYVENLLTRFGMENSRPVSTPLEPGVKYYKSDDNDVLFDVSTYQRAISSLNYAALCTRPDISAAVGVLSQFMSKPNETHWSGVKRILRYLRGTSTYGLMYDGSGGTKLVGFSDADWAGDINTRRSTSGYAFQLGNSTITWSCRKQATVAKSSTEAEYVALSMATQEAVWLRRLLHDIGVDIQLPTTIFEDNQGAIDLSKNPKHHNGTKHIDICHHFVRERVASKEVAVSYCPTDEMTADVLTKGLHATKA